MQPDIVIEIKICSEIDKLESVIFVQVAKLPLELRLISSMTGSNVGRISQSSGSGVDG